MSGVSGSTVNAWVRPLTRRETAMFARSSQPSAFLGPYRKIRPRRTPLHKAADGRSDGFAPDSVLFPDAVQREALKGVYARLRGLCGAVRRRAGIVPNSETGTVPGLQRTTFSA